MTAVLAAVVFALLLALGAVQLGSDAIFASVADAHSLPAHVPAQTGVAIYGAIARVAPAPYVNDMLARSALASGDLHMAQAYVQRLPVSANRSELQARLALARGDERAAQEAFVNAGDVLAIEAEVRGLAQRDPAAAYGLETQLKDRLKESSTHPDAVAEAYWHLAVLAAQQHRLGLAMANYRRAIALSPISSKYLISAGFQAYDLRLYAEAQRDFQRAIGVDPASADAYAGAGMVALRLGDREGAQAYAERSRALDPDSHALSTLQTQLQQR